MKSGNTILLLLLISLHSESVFAQENGPVQVEYSYPQASLKFFPRESEMYLTAARTRAAKATGTINLFIFSDEKNFNLVSLGFRFNTRIASLFHKNIKILKVASLADLAVKANALMESYPDKMIRHLWFDSHGKYKTGHSLFNIGIDTLTIENILNPVYTSKLVQLTAYCNENSRVTIGACYAAATFKRPANQYLKESEMYGDSLFLALSSIFSTSPVFGTESWVMVKPLFFGNRWGISGYPIEGKYMDEIYRPVWERIGAWKKVAPGENTITAVHTPFLSRDGDLQLNTHDYLSTEKHQKKLNRKLKKLKPGVYKLNRK
jgi:hypothetical protein